MNEKPPLNNGEKPVQMYWIDDNPQHRFELGYVKDIGERCADLYAEYPGVSYKVIEFKSQEIAHALTQLRSTTRKIVKIGHPVDEVIIVMKKHIKKGEQSLFGRRHDTHELINPYAKKPYKIRLRQREIGIKLIYRHEIDQEYRRLKQRRLSDSERGNLHKN